MWHAVILTMTVALGGHLLSTAQTHQFAAVSVKGNAVAGEMATYRDAVIAYFTANPSQYNTVNLASLRAMGAIPAWSLLNSDNHSERWTNYRTADGTIFIYARPPLNRDVTKDLGAEIAQLSANSLMVGVFRTGDTSLFSPVFGNTGIPLPAQVTARIPNGSPVWIAMRN